MKWTQKQKVWQRGKAGAKQSTSAATAHKTTGA